MPNVTQTEVRKRSIHQVLSLHFRNEFIARIRRIIELQNLRREDYLELLERGIAAFVVTMERDHSVSFKMIDVAKLHFTDICAGQTD